MARTKKLSDIEIQAEAVTIVRNERLKWEESVAFVTQKVAFRIRYLIQQLRKNYWGVFDYPNDQSTGRQKTWVPLTQSTVENTIKLIDIDPKDVRFRAKKPEGVTITDVTRQAAQDWMREERFGFRLDELEREMAIDGTGIWKFIRQKKDGKKKATVKIAKVDGLNIYIDPTEDSIQSAYRFTERSLMLPTEIARMDGWMNRLLPGGQELVGSTGLARIDSQYRAISTGTTAKYIDVWEMWGKIPKYLITKDSNDKEEIDGHIVVSGLETGGPHVHLIEENNNLDKDGNVVKPYEECWYTKVGNRWWGVGPAEKIMWLQIWLNTIVNIRINRNYITQLGLHKIKKGSGITPAMLSRLSANGAILVTDMNDIMPLDMPGAPNDSYTDERVIQDWVQKVTSTYDIAAGADTEASSSATAVGLQNTNAKTAFTLIKKNVGDFVERAYDRHILPVLAERIAKGDMMRFAQTDERFADIVQSVVTAKANEELDKAIAAGYVPSQEVFLAEIQNAEEKVMLQKDVFVELTEDIIAEQLDTVVECMNTSFDSNVMVNNLMQMLPVAPEYKDEIIAEAFDLMGIRPPKKPLQTQPQQQMGGANPNGSQPMPTPSSMQQIITGGAQQPQQQEIA